MPVARKPKRKPLFDKVPPTNIDGQIRVGYWRGDRCIVLVNPAAPVGAKPLALRPIKDGESDRDACKSFINEVWKIQPNMPVIETVFAPDRAIVLEDLQDG